MPVTSRFAVLITGVAYSVAATSAFAVDPAYIAAKPAAASAPAAAPAKRTGGGIFGCAVSGNKQGGGALVGGLFGSFLGNRIAGRGNRTFGTLVGGLIGAASGSAIGCGLQKQDQAKAEQAMQDALAKGESQNWQSDSTGASGQVDVMQEPGLAGLKFAAGVEPWSGYQQIGAAFVSTGLTNVRARPGMDGRIVGQLPQGVRIWVPAAAEGTSWYLVSQNGVAWGYVASSVLQRVSDGTSGCKLVRQTVNLPNTGSQSETYQACQDPAGQWVLSRV